MNLLRRRGVLVLLVALGALVVVVTASRTWVAGTVDDAVLGRQAVSATGSESATGVVGIALVVVAGAVASAAAGRRARIVALALTGLAVLAGLLSIGRVVTDPEGVLGPIAAAAAGRSGSLETSATLGPWPWVAALGFVLSGTALLTLAFAVADRPAGLSSRYDAPASPTGARGAERARAAGGSSAWDQLSAGEDPTDELDDTPGRAAGGTRARADGDETDVHGGPRT